MTIWYPPYDKAFSLEDVAKHLSTIDGIVNGDDLWEISTTPENIPLIRTILVLKKVELLTERVAELEKALAEIKANNR